MAIPAQNHSVIYVLGPLTKVFSWTKVTSLAKKKLFHRAPRYHLLEAITLKMYENLNYNLKFYSVTL